MNELDFSGKQVLVVGGGQRHRRRHCAAFRGSGAHVHVCVRACPANYPAAIGSCGSRYAQLDAGDPRAIETFRPAFDRLDVLVLARVRRFTGAANSK